MVVGDVRYLDQPLGKFDTTKPDGIVGDTTMVFVVAELMKLSPNTALPV